MTIFRDENGEPIEGIRDRKCSICGERPADAHWSFRVYACLECAIEAFPAMIADAVRAKGVRWEPFVRAHEEMSRRYWECADYAMERNPRTWAELLRPTDERGERC